MDQIYSGNKPIQDINKLSGKTLLVYWTLLKTGNKMGVRELQRKLDFSSPSLAAYHIKKLRELSLIEKTNSGDYIILRKANIAELQDLVIIRALNHVIALPRFIFYAIVITILWVGYLLIFFPVFEFPIIGFTISFVFVNIISGFSTLFFWLEAWKSWQRFDL